jgi:type II secretion system protein C
MTFNIPERYPLVLNIMLAALVIPYFAARSVSDMIKMHYSANAIPAAVEKTAPRGSAFTGPRPRGVYNLIVERDVFNLTPAPVDTAPVEKENLDVTLIGTSHLTGGGPAFVIIQDQSGVQQLYRVGEMIPGAGKLLQVGQNRAIIEHNGHHVALDIPRDSLGQADSADDGQPVTPPTRFRPHPFRRPFIRNPMVRPRPPNAKAGGIRKLAPNQYAIDRSTVDSNVQNMTQLFTQIRAVPNLKNGASTGFRLSEIQPGSIFQQMGLRDGDVLTTVSGQPIRDPARALQMLSTLQTRSNITLNVMRNGAPLQLSYTIN